MTSTAVKKPITKYNVAQMRQLFFTHLLESGQRRAIHKAIRRDLQALELLDDEIETLRDKLGECERLFQKTFKAIEARTEYYELNFGSINDPLPEEIDTTQNYHLFEVTS